MMDKNAWKLLGLLALVGGLLISSALGLLPWDLFSPQPTEIPFVAPGWTVTPSPDPTPTSQVTPTPVTETLWLAPELPESFRARVGYPSEILQTNLPQDAAVRLAPGGEAVVSRWVYALVAPFPTTLENVPGEILEQVWRGRPYEPLEGRPLLMTSSTQEMLRALWGKPDPDLIQVVSRAQLSDRAWSATPSWAVVPFDQLNPSWKVLEVDGQSPLSPAFQLEKYPLVVPISREGQELTGMTYPEGNRDPDQLTSLVMTGVTALVRATAYTMEQQGITYPARDIREMLRGADLTHISNEVPFVQGCPYPDPNQKTLRFCSDPRYIELLEYIGTDVVELTGDHFGDWGPEAMLDTLELYQDREWSVYGGGANLKEAQQPLKLEHNGNRLAFLGCNAKGGGYATAGPDYPGAAACDLELLEKQIGELRAEGYLPIVTFQHFEYYTYRAQPDQIRDAQRMADAGAVIVSGSQAHQPQAFQFRRDALIHHGLGNLFFDQLLEIPPNTATAFIDRHIFYQGEHISTEPLTIQFVDFARPRPMTPEEREQLLEIVFQASGW